MIQTLQIVIMLLGAFGGGYLFKFYLNESLNKEINDLKAEIDGLSTQLAWSADEKNRLNATLSKANADLLNINNELAEKQNALIVTQADVEQLQSKAETLELENTIAAENIASLREQLQSDSNTSVEYFDRIERLSAELNKAKVENSVLLNEKEKLNTSIIDLKNRLENAENTLDLHSSRSETERESFENMREENILALETIATLKEQVQLNEITITDQIARIEMLQGELNRIKGENNSSTSLLQADYDNLNEENTNLKDSALELEAQFESLTYEVEQNKAAILALQMDNGELLVDIMALETNAGQVLNNNSTFEAQLEELSNEIEQNKASILALQMDKGELLVDILSLEENANQVLNISDEFEAKLLQLQNEKNALEGAVTELIKENEELMEQMTTIYETDVVAQEATIHPVQIEDEVEIEEHEVAAVIEAKVELSKPELSETEISSPTMSDSEISAPITGATEMDNDDVIPDDLKLVEGIGPKIQELLYNSGIKTFQRLSTTPVEHIRRILVLAGDRFAVHDPKSWPEQAALAAESKWDELQQFQAHLAAEAEKAEHKS